MESVHQALRGGCSSQNIVCTKVLHFGNCYLSVICEQLLKLISEAHVGSTPNLPRHENRRRPELLEIEDDLNYIEKLSISLLE